MVVLSLHVILIFPMEKLERNKKLATDWFENNYMKLNEDKCHLLVGEHSMELYGLKLWRLGFGKVRMKSYLD